MRPDVVQPPVHHQLGAVAAAGCGRRGAPPLGCGGPGSGHHCPVPGLPPSPRPLGVRPRSEALAPGRASAH